MADLEKTIAIIFQGDNQVSQTIEGISRNIDRLGARAVTATQPLADLAASALQLEAALAALVAGGFALAINEAGAFEDSFSEIATLVDASDSNLNQFRTDLVVYAQTSTASLEDINSAVYTAISAGTDYRNSIDLLTTSERLAIAGKADLEATTRLLASSMNAYGASTDEAGRYSDAFFETVRLGQTTLPELAATMAQITPIAGQMGVPIETLTASIAALTSTGVPTAQAITQIRSALVAFANPSAEAGQIAARLGVDFSAAAVSSRGFETVLNEIYTAANGDVEILSQMFGRVEALSAALVLGGDENGRFADSLESLRNSAGSTEVAFQRMADNIGLVGQSLRNNLRATLIDFGTPLLDETVDVMRAITELFQSVSFSFHSGAFDPIISGLESFGVDIAADIREIADALPAALEMIDWDPLIESVSELRGEVGDLFGSFWGDIDLTTPQGLSQAIQQIVSAGAGLTSFVTGVIEAWQPFVRAFGEIVEKILEFGDETFRTMGQVAGFGQAINTIASNIGVLTGGLNAIASGLRLLSITQIPAAITAVGRLTTSIGLGGIAGGGLIAPVLLLGSAFALIPNSPLRNLVDQIPAINNLTSAIDNFYLRLRGINVESADAAQSQGEYNRQLGIAAVQAHDLLDELDRIDQQNEDLMLSVAIDMDLTSFFSDIDQAKFVLDDMADKNIEVTAEVNEQSFEQAEQYIIETAEDGITTIVFAQPDQPSFEETREEIEELPSEKELEIRLQGEIDRELALIETQAETVQTAMEWTARVDIAEVEAAADTIIAMSGNVADMFASSGSTMVGLADALSELSSYDRLQLFDLLDNEARNRAQLLQMEANLTEAQINYLNARTASLESGEGGVVTIQANNIEPELQLVLHRIIELTQIAANEQGLEFLIGV